MRLFIALDIPSEIRGHLTAYVDRVRPLAPDARWARIESLHVTLKFIGEVSEAKMAEIKTGLSTVKAAPFEVEFREIGFFPTERSARVFWAGVKASAALTQLASSIEGVMERLGIAAEKRPYQPHLTLARAPENTKHFFRILQERVSAEEPPYFGTMTAQDFFLYQSRIMRGGSRYTKLQRFPLVETP